MSSEGLPSGGVREPKPGRLVLVGLCIVAGAGALVVGGVRGRAKTEQEVARRTTEQSVPSVELIAPQRGADAQELVLPGNIEAFSTAPIYARASGYVTAWYKDIGDRVQRGEKLADIDTPELDQQYAQAKADVANAQVNATMSAATAKRYRELVGQSIVSKQTDEEKAADASAKQAILESARANLARLEALVAFKALTAPFDGIVTTRSIDVGTLLNAGGTTGTALYQIADIHRVRIYVRVPQTYVADLKPGTKATLRLPQYPGRSFEAKLVGSSNAIAQESRTALVQLQAENPDGTLWPGTYAEVRFQLAPNPDALRVPATALIFGNQGLRVATVDGSGVVALKPVQIGRDIGNDVEVLAGLTASDQLINSPLETLNTGDKVRVVKAPPNVGRRTVNAEPPKKAD
jgi:RND family efflux transporter MFP subunit